MEIMASFKGQSNNARVYIAATISPSANQRKDEDTNITTTRKTKELLSVV